MGGYYYGYENSLTLLLLIIGFVVVMFADIKVRSSYKKYLKKSNLKGYTGSDVASMILKNNGLDLYVVETGGYLTDHYDPSRKIVKLSRDIYNAKSIASIAVAAHECGHAIQDKEGYSFMRLRSALVPFVNFVTYAGYFVLFISMFFSATGYFGISIAMLMATLLFQLVTLPVEFDASKRALVELQKIGVVENNEINDVRNMLSAAAFTYVAGMLSTLLSLLRIILMFSSRNRDD